MRAPSWTPPPVVHRAPPSSASAFREVLRLRGAERKARPWDPRVSGEEGLAGLNGLEDERGAQ